VARERERWRVCQRYMDGERFIFLDETGASTNMTRLYGWGERGERLIDHAPHGHWKTTTFVAGLTANGIIAPFVVDGPMNGEMFRAYVEQMLAPALRPGDVVVLDNLPAHKVAGIEAATRLPKISSASRITTGSETSSARSRILATGHSSRSCVSRRSIPRVEAR